MNSALNSDSKQCLESKLSWVHKVHTQRTLVARTLLLGRAHTTPRPSAQRRVASLPSVVSWPSSRPCRRSCRALCRSPCHSFLSSVVLFPAVSWRMPGRVAALYRDTLSARPRARAGRPYRSPAGRIMAPGWPCRRTLLHAQACCVTIQPIVSLLRLENGQ